MAQSARYGSRGATRRFHVHDPSIPVRTEQLHRTVYAYYALRMPDRFVYPLISALPTLRRSIKFETPFRSSEIIRDSRARKHPDARSTRISSRYRCIDSIIVHFLFAFIAIQEQERAKDRATRNHLEAVTPGNRTHRVYAFATRVRESLLADSFRRTRAYARQIRSAMGPWEERTALPRSLGPESIFSFPAATYSAGRIYSIGPRCSAHCLFRIHALLQGNRTTFQSNARPLTDSGCINSSLAKVLDEISWYEFLLANKRQIVVME